MKREYTNPIPEEREILQILKVHGPILFELCPSSKELVLFADSRTEIDEKRIQFIRKHMKVCLDCQDKVNWLSNASSILGYFPELPIEVLTLSIQLDIPHQIKEATTRAYAAASDKLIEYNPPVPFFENEDGSIFGEIGQDLRHNIFIDLLVLPNHYRGHALQVCVKTHDNRFLVNDYTLLKNSKIIVGQKNDITPEDLAQIELRFTHLQIRE